MRQEDELLRAASVISSIANEGETQALVADLAQLEQACEQLARSFSGSWLGYHAFVYYADLQPAPPGAIFSQEWGLKDLSGSSLGSRGRWRQYDPDDIRQHLLRVSKLDSLDHIIASGARARSAFEEAKAEVESIYELLQPTQRDNFITARFSEFSELLIPSSHQILQVWKGSGKIMTRDTLALGQGWKVPPHAELLAEVSETRAAFEITRRAAQIVRRMARHLVRQAPDRSEDVMSKRVFIGHGRSLVWRELKDFIQDRCRLSWDEFNRVPTAGIPVAARLNDMLNNSGLALLVLTAEDETAEGAMQARMNVIHEVGLFQGRLGFTKAIVLLEEGCVEFSNIAGLGQIRFPKGNVGGVFEEVRRVLEREGLVSS